MFATEAAHNAKNLTQSKFSIQKIEKFLLKKFSINTISIHLDQ